MDEQTLAGVRRIAGVTAALVVDEAGAVGGPARGPLDETQSVLLAALAGALRQAAADLLLGDVGETIVEAERGALVAGNVGGGRTVVVLTENKASLGMIRMEVRRLRRQA